jgi:hypothetical protein
MSSTTNVVKYSLKDFENIKNEGFNYTLLPTTLRIIQSIADQVGAPEYIKTPKFDKRVPLDNNPLRSKTTLPPLRNHNVKKNVEITDNDWDLLRSYQSTVVVKKQGFDASIERIRIHLNKMTTKTYLDEKEHVIDELDKINSKHKSKDVVTKELNDIGEILFTIASGNSFYSEIYAQLFKELMEKYDFMQVVFQNNFDSVNVLFKDFAYFDPEKDYDKFCECNKINEKRRALSLFYVNLMKQEVIKASKIIELINDLQTLLWEKMQAEGNKHIVEELSEVIFLLVTKGVEELSEGDEAWTKILSKVKEISLCKLKDYPSLTNKTSFKHMDILDSI